MKGHVGICAAVLAGAGCFELPAPTVNVGDWPDAGELELSGSGYTTGERGLAEFQLQHSPVDRPIAAGGAIARLDGRLLGSAAPIASVVSADPAVVAVRDVSLIGPSFWIEVRSGVAGTAAIALLDQAGREIDHIALEVADSDSLWNDGTSFTMIAGGKVDFHVSTVRGTVNLAGDGAVAFHLEPPLVAVVDRSEVPCADDLFSTCDGADFVAFQAVAPGSAKVTATAPSATAVITVTAISPAALDDGAIVIEPGPLTTVSAHVGQTPVYGVTCQWTAPPELTIQGPYVWTLGHDATVLYTVAPQASGIYHATCTIPGGLTKTVSFDFRGG
jgi:hypothetical protein